MPSVVGGDTGGRAAARVLPANDANLREYRLHSRLFASFLGSICCLWARLSNPRRWQVITTSLASLAHGEHRCTLTQRRKAAKERLLLGAFASLREALLQGCATQVSARV